MQASMLEIVYAAAPVQQEQIPLVMDEDKKHLYEQAISFGSIDYDFTYEYDTNHLRHLPTTA